MADKECRLCEQILKELGNTHTQYDPKIMECGVCGKVYMVSLTDNREQIIEEVSKDSEMAKDIENYGSYTIMRK